MWFRWLPWRYLISKAARSRGFLDPVSILSSLHRFSQPSEVAEPIELLRAGVVMHARGLINTKAIQHNLDWVWPYWVEQQFDPNSISFIPRAFSITHVNLTHRNWTGIGLPDYDAIPLVDPRGLLTPLFDGWSIDLWILGSGSNELLPSRLSAIEQRLEHEDGLAVTTRAQVANMMLAARAEVFPDGGHGLCSLQVEACSDEDSMLVLSVRPYNPEGVSFIHHLRYKKETGDLIINKRDQLLMQTLPARVHFATYREGDVFRRLREEPFEARNEVRCDVGMATAALEYRLLARQPTRVEVLVPLPESERRESLRSWETVVRNTCRCVIPDRHMQRLFEQSSRVLQLLSPAEVYAGPYTYKRFWFRDAAFILHALLTLNFERRVERVIEHFWKRQLHSGYFLSQEGEWDSNGEVLWILDRYYRPTGALPSSETLRAIRKGAEWIVNKRLPLNASLPERGLLPAGFSAEHLGPNDYYYWDNFWAIAGLQAAASICQRARDSQAALRFNTVAKEYLIRVHASCIDAAHANRFGSIPAAPTRRMDAGAIGNMVAGYPLQLFSPEFEPMQATVLYLREHCCVRGGFFQDMIHSGINAYLTLHIAQVMLRDNDEKFFELVQAVADIASSTGQWPEAVHPQTLGGCMGDGQHAWACAEWIMMLRSMFVREEGEMLVLLSGIPSQWRAPAMDLQFGPTLTKFGRCSISVEFGRQSARGTWQSEFKTYPTQIMLKLPGYETEMLSPTSSQSSVELRPLNAHR